MGKMVGVPAEVMKLVAAVEHVEAIDGLAKAAECRSTPTTVRASSFERSSDNSTANAKARPRVCRPKEKTRAIQL
jgi:hypothetical protein